MIAQLPMYDWPEVRPCVDILWSAVRDHLEQAGIEAPAELDRDTDMRTVWRRHDLVVGQTCGLPMVQGLAADAVVIGQFDHRHDGCRPGHYRSVVISRAGRSADLADFRGSVAAYNSTDSQSGHGALMDVVDPLAGEAPFFGSTLETEAHRESVLAVAAGHADLAAIDVLSWTLATRYEPDACAELDIVCATRPTPAPPVITARAHAALTAQMAVAIGRAVDDLTSTERDTLGVHGFVPATVDDYAMLDTIRRQATFTTLA